MDITFLGTGNAQATACYNTCFLIRDDARRLLVDAGGGNTILNRLAQAGEDWRDVRDIIVTHKHIDHLLGVVWLMRMICQGAQRGSPLEEPASCQTMPHLSSLNDVSRRERGEVRESRDVAVHGNQRTPEPSLSLSADTDAAVSSGSHSNIANYDTQPLSLSYFENKMKGSFSPPWIRACHLQGNIDKVSAANKETASPE